MTLKTPNHFDMEAFLEFAVTLNLERIVEPEYHNARSYNILNQILKEARSMV